MSAWGCLAGVRPETGTRPTPCVLEGVGCSTRAHVNCDPSGLISRISSMLGRWCRVATVPNASEVADRALLSSHHTHVRCAAPRRGVASRYSCTVI